MTIKEECVARRGEVRGEVGRSALQEGEKCVTRPGEVRDEPQEQLRRKLVGKQWMAFVSSPWIFFRKEEIILS